MGKFMKGVIYAVISALGFGIMPIFAVKSYQNGLSVNTLLFLRFSLSSVIFFLFFRFKKTELKIQKRDLQLLFFLGGVLFTLLSMLHFESIRYISAPMAVLFLFSFPIFVCTFSFFANKERPQGNTLVFLLFSFVGMIFLLGISLKDMNLYGVALAIGAAIVYACFMIMGKKAASNVSAAVTSAFVTLFAAVGTLITGLLNQNIHFDFNPKAWIYIICIVFVSTIIAEMALFRSLELLSSTNVSIVSMIEPVFTAIFSILFLNEHVMIIQLTGGLIVLISLALLVYFQSKPSATIHVYENSYKKSS
ncbi:DMT family transporter [Paenibacillus wynnii]|uniref:DMT family transporter n=1 Tax=Paenibacillus wynnii TaxID=268407 RepID=UPI00279166C0|nr:DMT family transporter [Paenibacillus wynnii]MDQ0194459.1 drug/metabolite transporter (DMT)-like permease [Paenibacillus wynnii]